MIDWLGQLDWISAGLAFAVAVCLYKSVSYVQSDTSGFRDPETGKAFPHVRVNKRLMVVGLALGVLSSLL